MQRTVLRWSIFVIVAGLSIAGCSRDGQDMAERVIEDYIQATTLGDDVRAVNLSCVDWEEQAQADAESFESVETSLEGVTCRQAGEEGDSQLIACSGAIVANYGAEVLRIDLADRIYVSVSEGGSWRMCGYR